MNAFKRAPAAVAAVVLAAAASAFASVGSAATGPTLPRATGDHVSDAATYDEIAQDLDAKAKYYAKMAERYRIRASGGTKQEGTLLSFARRYDRLAKTHSDAAVRARKLAESSRAMAEAK